MIAALYVVAALTIGLALAFGLVGLLHAPRPKKKRRQKK